MLYSGTATDNKNGINLNRSRGLFGFKGLDGAPEASNIEPNLLLSVLEKLEEWDQELKHCPVLILSLRELSSASATDDRLTKNPVNKPVPPRGPKRSGPSL